MLRLALTTVALVLLTSCQQPQTRPPRTAKPVAAKAVAAPPAPAEPAKPKIEYNVKYDTEIKGVLELANKNQWEEARVKAAELVQGDPQNVMLQRLQTWVVQQGQNRREQALEDEIRKIDAKNSVFNPTIPGLLTEQKDRGLPARKDVRDAIDKIENQPYIPEKYGKTIHEKGPLFDLDAAKGAMARVLEKEISAHLDNVPLETVIVNLSTNSGVNIVADKSLPGLTNRLTVNLEKVKLGEFLKYIGRNYDLQFQVGPELVWVVDGKDPKRLMEETRFYKLRKGFVLPAQFGATEVTKTTITVGPAVTVNEAQKFTKFVNDDAPAMPAIERAITNLFTGSKCFIDYERNQIIARGTAEQLEVLEKIIEEFDRPIQQVLIEARFVTLSKPAFLQLGVLWETGRPATTARNPQDFTGLLTDTQIEQLGLGLQYAFTNIINQSTLTATISALEQSGESQTLSAPRLTVINNRPASINDGKVQYYYEEYTVKQTIGQYITSSSLVPSGKPTKITSGAELNVMASIAGDGRHIMLALNPSVKTDVQLVNYATILQGETNSNDIVIKLPQYRTQEIATRVVIKSGETVVMGGVLEREKGTFVESVPILGNIPIIGALFRRRSEVDKPRYLLVFVTATILTDSGEYLLYDDKSGSDQAK
ncbi:MAG: type II secretion system protein GspD [Verrucomicrobiota bacterium]